MVVRSVHDKWQDQSRVVLVYWQICRPFLLVAYVVGIHITMQLAFRPIIDVHVYKIHIRFSILRY